ncbi:polysaccharide biosynthesis protein [Eubacteriales bacterium OttesenSCG-928-M02]|nr:polysaccharide biosynthesis protein [Eubacteriales bacterium OttesenSCG-928-M02]
MDRNRKSFAKGATILAAAGIICKILGAAFRIPLEHVLGDVGMAYYSAAYPIYSALLVISSSGIPAAISRLVAERAALGDYRNAHYIFQIAYKLLLLIGFVAMVLMLLGARLLASAQGMPEAYPTLMVIAPSIFFVAALSAYRGYFQGLQDMTPTAVSQVVEQVVKLGASWGLAAMMVKNGLVAGAVGAIIGVSISEVVALLLVMVMYNRRKGEIKYLIRTSPRVRNFEHRNMVVNRLLRVAIPITIGASIMPIVNLIDNGMVVRTLTSIGFSEVSAKSSFGILSAMVVPIINMPTIISSSLQVSLVPAISNAMALKNMKRVQQNAATGLKLVILIGLPCAVGLFLLGEPILGILYSSLKGDAEKLALAGKLIRTLSIGLFFLMVSHTATGILQGIGRQTVPVRNLAIGGVLKVIVSYLLLRLPEINIQGATIGTTLCYTTAAVLNLISILRHVRFRFSFGDFILRPLIANGLMGAVCYFSYRFIAPAAGNIAGLGISIVLAVLVYVVTIFLVGAIRPEDTKMLPGGNKLDYLMRRLGIWR